ncbi:hypothetical protein K6308_000695 [Vibrio parahaemolyticus]|nr:hypothetical protein [Vibrio parahaemolyticus]EJP5145887.1 hypothetical protein [Vibrio parahaemolyticus]
MAKRFNGLGLSGISMVCAGFASPQEPLLQCVLYPVFMLSGLS